MNQWVDFRFVKNLAEEFKSYVSYHKSRDNVGKNRTILESRNFLLLFFLYSKCCFPALLRTIFPLPVTLNRFAEAYQQTLQQIIKI